MLLQAKMELKSGTITNTLYTAVKAKMRSILQTPSFIEKHINEMDLKACQELQALYNDSSAITDRMLKNIAQCFITELGDINRSLIELSDLKEMILTGFEHSYTTSFFDGKMSNQSFENMMSNRLSELENEAEISRRVQQQSENMTD